MSLNMGGSSPPMDCTARSALVCALGTTGTDLPGTQNGLLMEMRSAALPAA